MHHTKSKLSGMINKGFKADKCKVSLRMAMSRMKLLRNKRDVQIRQMKRDVAQLLQSGQNQTARIRVEHVIREEKTMAAYELLELYCELIVARLTIIDSQKICPIDLREAISSVIFATPRCADVLELMDVQKQFLAKYGKDFTTAALELRPECGVSHMVVEKLSAKAPDMDIKIKTLKSIAEEHGIEWDPKALLDELQKQKNDLLVGYTQFPSENQVVTDHPAASNIPSLTQSKPTQFLSASQVAMGYSANDSSTSSVQTSSQSKPTQFLSASEVMMGHSDSSSSTDTGTGQTSFAQTKDGDMSEGDVAKPPDDQVPPHGGIISSTGSIIYPPPPPFMKFEESAPSHTQPEFASPDGTSRQEKTEQKYKDAKEAAREAAKSAERAQMAARAAAELARQENRARGRAQVEEDMYNMPPVGSVEDAPKQSDTENLDMHNHQAVQDSQSDEEEEITIHGTGPDRENEYDVFWDKHEPSSVAVFDQSDSDMDDHSSNMLDTFTQPKKEEYATSEFYWREKADSKKHDRSESVFFEGSTEVSSPPSFVNSSAPAFDSDGLSSDDENKGGIKASKEQSYIHSGGREEKEETEFPVGMKNTRVPSDDDNDKPKIELNFGKLTGGLKNKGYRRTPYVKKPTIDATPSVKTLDDHEVYVSPRTKNPPTSDVDEFKASSAVSVEAEKGQRGSKKLASRFNTNYFDTEDEVEEPENQQVQDIDRLTNKNIIKHSRRTRGAITSRIRKNENIDFGGDRHPESPDEENTNESAVAEKSGLEEDQAKSSASPSSVRYRRPPDYDSLAAHFRSLRTNRS